MPRQKHREIIWSDGRGYRIRIPYLDPSGTKRIYYQIFSARKLGLDMAAAKRLARAERDRLMQVLGAVPPKTKKARRRSKAKDACEFTLLN
jgi:hypothetical protein